MDLWEALQRDESWRSEDTLATEDDMVDESVMTLAEIDNQNRILELALDLEESVTNGADAQRFKQLRSNFVFAGSMLVRAYQQKQISEDSAIYFGQNINRCKRVCEKKIIESANF
ncbi:MAG: hypothetical protein ACXADH_12550 [Candidatus Kariarchaeaceae archaeon]|jgi:hypothetical protein